MVIKKKLNVIIFGASGSIGNKVAVKFYKEGHNLLLFFKDKKKLKSAKKKFKNQLLQKIYFQILDFEKENEIKDKIVKNKNFIRKSNLIINATGAQGEIKNFFKLNEKKFHQIFKINFYSQILLIKHIYKIVKKSKGILIILFSGGGVTSMRENFSPYSLTKIALVKLVEILSVEFKNKKIRINAISPGIIDSKMTRTIVNQNKKNIKTKERNKIKKGILKSKQSINKIINLIDFLISSKGNKISGKIISSRWDAFEKWDKKKIKKIIGSDLFTLRRVK